MTTGWFGGTPWRNVNLHRMKKFWSPQPPPFLFTLTPTWPSLWPPRFSSRCWIFLFFHETSCLNFHIFRFPEIILGSSYVPITHGCYQIIKSIWWFPKGYPKSSSISNDGIFHDINHPAIGVPPFMETPICCLHLPATLRNRRQGRIFSGYSLVGHSLGGLVARVIAVHVDLAPRNLTKILPRAHAQKLAWPIYGWLLNCCDVMKISNDVVICHP